LPLYSSTFDENVFGTSQVAELVWNAKDGGLKKEVVVLASIPLLDGAWHNNLQPKPRPDMSADVESKALMKPKGFFGGAACRGRGEPDDFSTALIETGSRMDEVILKNLKEQGTWS